jgi:ATP-dependent DNA helicase RecG
VHRTWDVDAHINVAMFPDKIEITSPGSLPQGVSEADFLRGGISIPRNRIVASVFFRLQLIERFGTGIRRINESYAGSKIKPVFETTENTIRIILPVMQMDHDLKPDEDSVYTLLKGKLLPSSVITEKTGFGKSKTVAILNKLAKMGYIRVHGTGRGTKYSAE